MPLSVHWALLFSAISALLFAAAFPPLDFGLTAYVAFVPLLLASRRQPARRALLLGWLTGTIGGSLLVSPSINAAALRYFAESPWIDMAFALIAPQFYGAIYFAAFAWVASRIDPLAAPGRYILLLASSWILTEYARSYVWHGCPWALLAHSQHERLWMVQIADIAGTAGIGFAIMAVNAALAPVLLSLTRWQLDARVARAAGFTMLMVIGIAAYGRAQVVFRRQPGSATVSILAVQGAVPPAWRASPAGNARALRKLEELTLGALDPSPDLVVWPENAVGFAVTGNEVRFGAVTDRLPPSSRLLVGAPRTVSDADGQVRFRNSAFLLAPGSGVVATYDKIRLTPYAEYSPLADLPILRSRYRSASLYTAGKEPTLLVAGGHAFATMICFEAIYAELARTFVEAGATFLVNISNDDWFGGHAAVRQHFIASIFRSIETRRPLLRTTNSGITAVIDSTGRVVSELPVDQPGTLKARITPATEMTFYVRYGDVFVALCALVMLALLPGGRVLSTQ